MARSIDELGGGVDDSAVFAFARNHERIVVTYNNDDFKLLGENAPEHPGILLIYQDNKPSDMNTSDPNGIADEMIVLNAYRW